MQSHPLSFSARLRGPRALLLPALLLSLFLGAPARAQGTDDDETPTAKKPVAASEGKDAKESSPDPGIQAPTIGGLSGLFRTVTGDIGSQHTFRLALHMEMFKSSDFLVLGDSHSRFVANLSASYTPWKYLELFAQARSMANDNERAPESGRLDQQVILALGDFGFGAKFAYPVHRAFKLGANIGLGFLNSVGGVSIDGDSTSFYIGMLSSLDFREFNPSAAIRAHFTFGFQLDNSGSLAAFPNYPLSSLQVEKFALGINPSRLQLRIGLDAPLERWTKIGVTPILEFAFDIATTDSDLDFDNTRFVKPDNAPAGDGRPLTASDITGRLTAWATIGVRVRPARGLNVELATDIGMVSPGYGYGPPVVPWNIILGVSYAYDPKPRIKTVTHETVRTVVRRLDKPVGKLRGRIINAKTLEPVEGAIVTFPGRDLTGLSSDPDGGFLSYGFPAGSLPVMVRHPRYKPAKASAKVTVGAVTKIEVKLTPKPPEVGTLDGSIVDLKNKPVAAAVAITGPETKTVTANASGAFNLKLKPGEYTLAVTATGFLRKEQKIKVTAGGTATVAFAMSPKPRRSLIIVTKRAIVIKRKVHFATNTADIKPDSRQLLDSVVDVLLGNPQLRIEIQGHTDNRGSRQRNMVLSQARAESVRDYLVKNGIAADRLTAKGFGPSKPKRPNITARNRAANRRVEFAIVR